jgi:ribose transport system ATP-binding protein
MHARRAGVAMIYQELSLCPHLSVEENILLGMEPTTAGVLRRREIRKRALDALGQLGYGDLPPSTRAGNLSVAMQQMVEIGRAIAVGSRVLVLDEPTSSLTQADVQRLFALVARLKADGHAIVYISHFLEEVKQVADHLTVLRDGRSVGTRLVSQTSVDEIIAMMVGREVTDLYPRSPRRAGEAVLELRDLAGSERPRRASLTLHRGEVLGIAGLMGAGRTELLRTIFGLDPVRRGDIRVAGYVGPASPARRLAGGMGMVSEDRKAEGLALKLSIADNLTLSRLGGLGGGIGSVVPSKQDVAAAKWIERLGVRCRGPRQAVGALSGGNQQKVAIARLLHHDVDVLLLDEPTRGIDVASKAEIYRLIDQLACQGKAILMVSSYLPELTGTCDRIAVMCRGVLGEAHPVEQVDAHQIMLEATGG